MQDDQAIMRTTALMAFIILGLLAGRLGSSRSGKAQGLARARSPEPWENVTHIALRWGFTHLARFSGVYRARFGELPSQTLAVMRQPTFSVEAAGGPSGGE